MSQWKAHINPSSGKDHHMNRGLQGTARTKRKKWLKGMPPVSKCNKISIYNLFKTCLSDMIYHDISEKCNNTRFWTFPSQWYRRTLYIYICLETCQEACERGIRFPLHLGLRVSRGQYQEYAAEFSTPIVVQYTTYEYHKGLPLM